MLKSVGVFAIVSLLLKKCGCFDTHNTHVRYALVHCNNDSISEMKRSSITGGAAAAADARIRSILSEKTEQTHRQTAEKWNPVPAKAKVVVQATGPLNRCGRN
jgi:hypothetical protein